MSHTIGPIERGQDDYWALITSALVHTDNIGTILVKVVLVSLILFSPVVLVSLGLLLTCWHWSNMEF